MGLETGPGSQQVLFVAGAVWACGADVTIDERLMHELSERTKREPCRTTLPVLQRPLGAATSLRWHPEGCGKWIPPEFRLCVADAKATLPSDTREVAIYARGGSFYAQKLEAAGLEIANGCRQSAFFHFQEWKKLWAKESEANALSGAPPLIAPFPATSLRDPPPFKVSTAGISILTASGQEVARTPL